MKLTNENIADINKWINLSAQNESIQEELLPEWEVWVAKPVTKHRLAPRQARACLELLGILADNGIPVSTVLTEIYKKFLH